MILRLSARLAKKIKAPVLPRAGKADNPFLDWHCSLFTFKRSRYMIVSNSTSLFSVFMHGLKKYACRD
jgi:hypothetical protein